MQGEGQEKGKIKKLCLLHDSNKDEGKNDDKIRVLEVKTNMRTRKRTSMRRRRRTSTKKRTRGRKMMRMIFALCCRMEEKKEGMEQEERKRGQVEVKR